MRILSLAQFYEEVDWVATRLSRLHGDRLRCGRGCSECCIDDLTVYEVEAENIRKHHAQLLESGRPHPSGSCAFLGGAGECRIYRSRPYVCRTQGLPFRWIEEKGDDDYLEMRDICPLNEGDGRLERLHMAACWTIGPFEEQLVDLQMKSGSGKMTRIPLRQLFATQR